MNRPGGLRDRVSPSKKDRQIAETKLSDNDVLVAEEVEARV